MPRHIVRLILLLVAAAALGYAAIAFLTVDSFYQYGHYRGDSVAEIASDKPKYQGTAYCQSCHAEQSAAWSEGAHNRTDAGKAVICETCHGPAGGRDGEEMLAHVSTGPVHPDDLKLAVPSDTRELCTLCHEKMPARPAEQPQIVVAEHAGEQQCAVCHDPHSPLLNLVSTTPMAQAGDAAAGAAKAADCIGCHGAEGVSVGLPGPTLAGQKAAYLVESFKAYKTGARAEPMMSAFAQMASDEDAANLAAYYSGLTCESTLTADAQAASPGRAEAAPCVACHGADGVSPNPAWPNLVGLSKDHLVTALNAYRDGGRKNAMMAGTVRKLSDADIENVAAYYAGASCR
ncbi:MAG: c-type cytochrome [Hyphomicrobiales bacterium]|nr:c-type cytochrome [Hyphomicrobiales bacterium]